MYGCDHACLPRDKRAAPQTELGWIPASIPLYTYLPVMWLSPDPPSPAITAVTGPGTNLTNHGEYP